MKAAIYTGLLSPDQSQPQSPLFMCPSGHCTWKPVATLSIDTTCENLTSKVKLVCTNLCSSDGEKCAVGGYSATDLSIPASYWDKRICNLTSSDADPWLKSQLKDTDYRTFLTIRSDWMMELGDVFPSNDPVRHLSGAFAGVQWARVSASSVNPDAGYSSFIYEDHPYDAGICVFYFSVKLVQPSVVNGVYNEKVLTDFNHDPSVPTYTGTLENFPFVNVPWPDLYNMSDVLFKPSFLHNHTFNISQAAFANLAGSLTDPVLFNGTVVSGSANGFVGPTIPLMLLRKPNITRAMTNMATYMTNVLRANDSLLLQEATGNPSAIDADQAVLGDVLVPVQYVIVRWWWLALPLLTLVASTLFLILVIAQTAHFHVGIWKTSPLTLYFQSTMISDQGGAVRSAGPCATATDMKHIASRYTARVANHWRDGVTISK